MEIYHERPGDKDLENYLESCNPPDESLTERLDSLVYHAVTLRWFVSGKEHKVYGPLNKTWAGYHVYGAWLPIPFSASGVGSIVGTTITLLGGI